MLTIDYLREFGADIQEGMERCMNDEAFYLELVDMVLDDESFEELSSAVKADDKKAAFSAAHALKGLTANVALTPLATVITEMTDLLREEKTPIILRTSSGSCRCGIRSSLNETVHKAFEHPPCALRKNNGIYDQTFSVINFANLNF